MAVNLSVENNTTQTHRFTRFWLARETSSDELYAQLYRSREDPTLYIHVDEISDYPAARMISLEEAARRGIDSFPPHLEIRPKNANLSTAPLLQLLFTGTYGAAIGDIELAIWCDRENAQINRMVEQGTAMVVHQQRGKRVVQISLQQYVLQEMGNGVWLLRMRRIAPYRREILTYESKQEAIVALEQNQEEVQM